KTVPVLFTGKGRKPGQIAGRSPWLQPVHVIGPDRLIGQTVPVRITERLTNSLGGILEEENVYA
ncbi:MAG: TRAM domain-containing protein, partial [Acetobacter sp.]|nr:TRAM domain-containing protein [Acetobacter sp.]